MRRLISSLLLASFLFLTATFAGMSVFGMGLQMGVATETCVGSGCTDAMDMAMHHDAPAPAATDCVDHCLTEAMAMTTSTMPSVAMLSVLLLFFALLLSSSTSAKSESLLLATRLSEGIGKELRHLQLATVVLRN